MAVSPTRSEYVGRINRVRDYVDAHLAEPLTLERLAEIACFSPFHFHRIFRALIGEPIGQYVQRLRLERAAAQLMRDPDKPVTSVAIDCGFSSPAAFSRAFREQFGRTPSAWRSEGSKISIASGKPDQQERNAAISAPAVEMYVDPHTRTLKWRINMDSNKKLSAEVEVKELPAMTVAYLRHIGSFQADSSFFAPLLGRLMQWAARRGLLGSPETRVLTMYRDDPDVTDPDKLRIDVCVTVPPDTAVEGEIGKATVPGGRYAVARFDLLPQQFSQAWEAVYAGWLPESGFVPDGTPLEIYESPGAGPEGKYVVDICVPVRPL